MIFTNSAFIYGPEVDENNLTIDLNEGSGEINIELNVGGYVLSDIATEVQRALNDAGALTYTVTMDRSTRKMTIAGSANFSLLFATGSFVSTSAAAILGYSAVDLSGTDTYTSDLTIGTVYNPQFKLQEYIAFEDWQELTQESQSESASGIVEVISFANINFMQCNITLANDYDQYGVVERNLTGVSDLREFMKYIVKKLNVEFIPDREDVNTYHKVLLEKTPSSRNGTGFKLKELYGRGLVGYYETGTLQFREV